MNAEIRPLRAPLERGTSVLVAALMRRLGEERITLSGDELKDVEVQGDWNYQADTVTLEVTR